MFILPETAGAQAARRGRTSRASACARATRAAARTAARSWQLRARLRPRSPRRPCSPRAAGATSPARRSRASASAAKDPQVWALGVKEVWEVAQPLDKVIHTLGWPLRPQREVQGVRRLVDLPDGRGRDADASRSASSPGSTTPTRSSRCTTCCRSSRRTRSCARSSRAASAWRGARRRSPRAATGRCRRLHAPGPGDLRRRRPAWSTCPSSRASTTRSQSGMLAAETIYRAAQGRARRDFSAYEAGGPRLARSARTSTSRAT